MIELYLLPFKESLDADAMLEFIKQLFKQLNIVNSSQSVDETYNKIAAQLLEALKENSLEDMEELFFTITDTIKTMLNTNKDIVLTVNAALAQIQDTAIEPPIDNKILQSPKVNMDDKEAVQTKILDSLTNFEALKQNQQEMGEDVSPTENVINTLKETLRGLNKSTLENSKLIDSKRAPNEPLYITGLKEIFYFYTRTQMMLGKKPTFDEIINELNTMNLVEFMKFAKDFEIPLQPLKLRDLYKKNAYLSREMRVEHYIAFIKSIAKQINDDKISDLTKKVADNNKKIAQTNAEIAKQKKDAKKESISVQAKEAQMPDQDPNAQPNEDAEKKEENKKIEKAEASPSIEESNKAIESQTQQLMQTINEISDMVKSQKEELKILQAKTQQQAESELFAFLQCEDPNKYRKKMKAIILPFGTKEKNIRIPWDDTSRKYKFKSNLPPDQIKEEVKKIKEKRVEAKKQKEQEKEEKYKKSRKVMESLHKKLSDTKTGSASSSHTQTKKYSDKLKAANTPVEKANKIPTKLTIKDIKNMSSKDFGIDTDINPLEDIDEEDDIDVLKKFHIISDTDAHNIKKKADSNDKLSDEPVIKGKQHMKEEKYLAPLQYAPEMAYNEPSKGEQIKNSMLLRAKEIEQSSKAKNDKSYLGLMRLHNKQMERGLKASQHK